MDQIRYTTADALDVLDRVLSGIDHAERTRLAAQKRGVLMGKARRVQERVASLGPFVCEFPSIDDAPRSAQACSPKTVRD